MERTEVVRRGRALVGVRFRRQGRAAEHGLDCVGLAAAAAGIERGCVPADYPLRSDDRRKAEAGFQRLGFRNIDPSAALAGDFLLVRAGPHQLHVLIITDGGYLHADAGLRRVVEVPGAVDWPVLSAWQHPGAGEG